MDRHTPHFWTISVSRRVRPHLALFRVGRRGIKLVVHGDDFVSEGERDDPLWLEE